MAVAQAERVHTVADKGQWTEHLEKGKHEKKAVVIDFSAVWCGPCRMIGPYFDEQAKEYPSIIFLKVDVDAVEDVARECGISAMPTFQVWVNGEKVHELVGASKDKLKALLEQFKSLSA